MRSAGDDVILEKLVSEGLLFLKNTKGSKKQGKPPLKAKNMENLNEKLKVHGDGQHLISS